MQVPTGGQLPTADGRVQMYPCFAFEFHLLLLTIDPDLGKTDIRRYFIGHDCGTVINPKIVRGMTMGGIAHGIGAALYEEFAYDAQGQLVAQSFMDYLLPSAHEVPSVDIVHHVTPSPHTVLGRKGSGESGYLGAPAAIASAVNDAVRPLGIVVNSLPIKMAQLADIIAPRRGESSTDLFLASVLRQVSARVLARELFRIGQPIAVSRWMRAIGGLELRPHVRRRKDAWKRTPFSISQLPAGANTGLRNASVRLH
jgi:hypothetical protein